MVMNCDLTYTSSICTYKKIIILMFGSEKMCIIKCDVFNIHILKHRKARAILELKKRLKYDFCRVYKRLFKTKPIKSDIPF